MTTFKNYKFKDYISKTLNDINFVSPTPVQEKALPLILKKKNVAIKSPTGSGKTHAYLLPLLQNINIEEKRTSVLILLPTRELATQIYQNIKAFTINEPNLFVKLLVGGQEEQQVNLIPQIVVATPSRIHKIGLVNANLNLSKLTTVVIDEADMLMENGFFTEIENILNQFKVKQTIFLSATINEELKKVLESSIDDLHFIIENKSANPQEIKHYLLPLRHLAREEILISLVKSLNPYLLLIFVSKKEDIHLVSEALTDFHIAVIHGDLQQNERNAILKRIQGGKYNIVVASDMLSRGIDLPVSDVINFNLPYKKEYFLHRSGRTGRNGKTGNVYTIVDKFDLVYLQNLINLKETDFIKIKDNTIIKAKNPFVVEKKKYESEEVKKIVNSHRHDKVKPGYKKKVKELIQTQLQKEKRKAIQKKVQATIKRGKKPNA
jgi:ATP-dependent RNA helicase CshB